MHMSASALPPVQPRINEADRKHPLFPLYGQHREFCSNSLIQASAFADWLFQYEQGQQSNKAAEHSEYPAFMRWMHANRGGARRCPAGEFPHNFSYWLNGGRW